MFSSHADISSPILAAHSKKQYGHHGLALLLPLLTFIAPGGSGKSTLLQYVRLKELKGAIPSAHVDFTLPTTPKDLLPCCQLVAHPVGRTTFVEERNLNYLGKFAEN